MAITNQDKAELRKILAEKGSNIDSKLKKVTDFLTREINENAKSRVTSTVAAGVKIDDLLSPVEALNKQYKIFFDRQDEAMKSGFSNYMRDLGQTFDEAAKQSYRLNGNFEAATRGLGAFMTTSKSFVFMAKDVQQALLDTTIKLEGLGFAQQDLVSIIDSSAMAFGKSSAEIKSLMATLGETSLSLAMNPQELAQDFQYAQQNFAYNSDRFMDNFLELETMARKTGLSFKTLAGSFGDSMDTFSGSAQMAGRLNQILGKSIFNSIDLLNKTEAERSTVIREQVIKQFGNRVNNLKKFELKAIASSLGMSVEETRRFLRTGKTDATGKDKMDKLKATKIGPEDMATSMENFVKNIEKFREPFTRETIRLNSAVFRLHTAVDYAGTILEGMGMTSFKNLSPSQKRAIISEGQIGGLAGQGTTAVDAANVNEGNNMGYEARRGFSRYIKAIADNENLRADDKLAAIAQLKTLYEIGSNNMVVADASSSLVMKAAFAGKFGKNVLSPGTIATFLTAAGLKVASQILGAEALGPALEEAIASALAETPGCGAAGVRDDEWWDRGGRSRQRQVVLLKVDCEGCEWRTFRGWLEGTGVFVRQILAELHWPEVV